MIVQQVTPIQTSMTGVAPMALDQQHMADNLKAVVLKMSNPSTRKRGMEAVKRLENAHWLPDEFQMVVSRSGGFEINADGDLERLKGYDRDIDAVLGLVNAYIHVVDPTAKPLE
jgi:hypothetical protein